MHDTAPAPYTATHVVHLVGGPLCGADIEAPVHASEMTCAEDATYGEGPHRVSLAGETYYYSAYLSTTHKRPTFRHHRLPWNYGSK